MFQRLLRQAKFFFISLFLVIYASAGYFLYIRNSLFDLSWFTVIYFSIAGILIFYISKLVYKTITHREHGPIPSLKHYSFQFFLGLITQRMSPHQGAAYTVWKFKQAICLLLMFFTLCGAYLSINSIYNDYGKKQRQVDWQEWTPCQAQLTYTNALNAAIRLEYQIEGEYLYKFNGAIYEQKRHRALPIKHVSQKTDPFDNPALGYYNTTCYVNPNNPMETAVFTPKFLYALGFYGFYLMVILGSMGAFLLSFDIVINRRSKNNIHPPFNYLIEKYLSHKRNTTLRKNNIPTISKDCEY